MIEHLDQIQYLNELPTMEDVYRGEEKALFNVISTFAGGGGSSTGYRLAGGKILCINEFIPAARDTYRANYPNTPILPEDIRELSGEDFLKASGIEKGELDILDGSPPCASFSSIGKREELWGKVKKYSDKEQRTDDLFNEFARILKELQPRVFIAENVKGLTLGNAMNLLGNGQLDFFGEHKKTFTYILEEAGYRVKYKVMNAKNFYVPQSRERLIIIGVREDLGIEPSFPPIKRKIFTLRDAIGDIVNTPEEIEEASFNKETELYKYILLIKQGEDASKYHPKGSYFNLCRLVYDNPSFTIIQSGNLRSIHPEENRGLTIREVKRVQSFPDDFILTGSYNKRWERVGRAVPPLMMKAIGEHIYSEILSKVR